MNLEQVKWLIAAADTRPCQSVDELYVKSAVLSALADMAVAEAAVEEKKAEAVASD